MFEISHWQTYVIINMNNIMFPISHCLTYVKVNVYYIMFQISHLLTNVIIKGVVWWLFKNQRYCDISSEQPPIYYQSFFKKKMICSRA